jgi:GT2 family glycosyltransferase
MARTADIFPKVFIVVINYNGYNDTIECLESVKKLNYSSYEVLIVDNGSTDGSNRILKSAFPEITLIETGRNLGFAGGSNAGIRHALAERAECIILLNNDTVVDPEFARELVEVSKRNKKGGIFCSKVYFFDKRDVISYAGGNFNPWLGWGRHRGGGMRDEGQFDKVEETARPCGCSLMVTKEFCEKVGLLDEDFFCYCEDIDWGMRAKREGFKVFYVPGSKVWHKVSKSVGGAGNAISIYYNVRNTLRCLDKSKPLPFPFRHMRYATVPLTNLLGLFTMKIPKISGIRMIYKGLKDYFSGKFGMFAD